MQSNVMSPPHEPTLFCLCQATPVKVIPIMPTSTESLLFGRCQSTTLNVTTHAPTSTVTSPSEQFNPSAFMLDDDDDDVILLSADKMENENDPSKHTIPKNILKTNCLRLRLLGHPQRLLNHHLIVQVVMNIAVGQMKQINPALRLTPHLMP